MVHGGAEGIRTPDPLDANEVRYQAAPQPQTGRVTLPPGQVATDHSLDGASARITEPLQRSDGVALT